MKVYKKRTSFNIYLFSAAAVFATGLLTALAMFFGGNTDRALLALTALPVLFVCVFFAFYEKNCRVLLTDKLIYIGHNVFSDERKYRKTSVSLKYSDIERISVRYYRVQGKKPLDENVYTFVLRDGSEVKTYFYEYGEENEKEILDFLGTKVRIDY